MRVRRLAVVSVVLTLGLVACGDNGGGTAASPSATATTAASPSALLPATSADAAAEALFAAWAAADRERAIFYATQEVADFLLGKSITDADGAKYSFFACKPSTKGGGRAVCTFSTAQHAVNFTMAPDPESGFRCVGVKFIDKTSV